ncbi:MAG TPA: ABC transporter substrate-binding protein, partial [Ktedonobacterales bacterium]
MLLALFALALAGCGLPWSQSSARVSALPDAKQIVRMTIPIPNPRVELLDPAYDYSEASSWQAQELVYSGLMTLDTSLRPVPALADQVAVSPDGLRYTFHLRRGARFSDGSPITSADAAFSIARLLLGSHTAAGTYYSSLLGFDALEAGWTTGSWVAWHDGAIARQLGGGPLARALLTPDPS